MRTASFTLLASLLLTLFGTLEAQLPPDQALASMQAAEGLRVSLFAAEPEVLNPTCFDVDPEGRVWVCEGVNYRGKAKPPFRKTGDRIAVLEDLDGDGRCDRSRTFYEGLDIEAPLGICHLGDRVYISQSPRIFSIEIRPDGTAGEKRDFLTGFDGVNHDHGVHSLVLGPDGLFYCAFGNSGATIADRTGRRIRTDGRPHFGGMVFRSRVEGDGLEALAHNFRNNYECALDSFGTIFQSDNDDDGNQWVRFVYVMQGGNYGYLGPTGRSWNEEKKSHWHMEDPGVAPIVLRTGAGSPTGLCVYEGDLLPARYRGMPIHADAGPRVVQCFKLRPLGAGYHVEEAPLDEHGRQTVETLSTIVKAEVLLTSSDSWFRPSDVAVAPDGSLLVSDWYDPGVGGHGMGDTSRGRIYRLTPTGHAGYRPPPFDLAGEEGLARALASPALSARSLAVLSLEKRGEKALSLLRKLAGSPEAALRARALWLLGKLPGGRPLVEEALSDPDPRFRVLSVRSLKSTAPPRVVELAPRLAADPDPQVRREALLAFRDLPGEEAMRSIAELGNRYDGQDRFYLAAIGIACRGRESEAFRAFLKSWGGRFDPALAGILWELHPPEAAPFLVERLRDPDRSESERSEIVKAIGELAGDSGALALASLAGDGGQPVERRRQAAAIIAKALGSRWKSLLKRSELRDAAEALLRAPGLVSEGMSMVSAGPIRPLRSRVEEIGSAEGTPDALRIGAIRALAAIDDPASVPLLLRFVRSGSPPPSGGVSGEAIDALGRMSGAAPIEALKEVLLSVEEASIRSRVVKSLGGTRSGALSIVRLAQEGELPEAARALAATTVHSVAYEEVRLLAAKVLPPPRTKGGQELPPPARLLEMKGDAERGRRAFFDEEKGNCGRCHRIKEKGSDVGPELTVIGVKLGREALLEAVLSPSASISPEHRVWILSTRSAGFVSGTIAEETAEGITLRDANGKKLSFRKADVLERTQSDASLMPEGLVGTMTPQDLMDIVEFLASRK